MTRTIVALITCIVVSGCVSGVAQTGSVPPGGSASQTATVMPTQALEPSTEPTSAAAAELGPETVLRVMVDGLRMRDEPSMSGQLVDTLNAGESVGAIDGRPIEADGHDWYEVRQGPGGRSGWVSSGPDGDWLAVVRNGRIAFACTGCTHSGGTGGTFSTEADRWDPLTLLDQLATPTWSPDGTRLALVTGDLPLGPETRLLLMSADGSGQVDMGTGTQPAWSPDGTQLVYLDLSEGRLVLLDADGDRTVLPAAGTSPAWSPDGLRLTFEALDCPECEPGQPIGGDPPIAIFLFAPPSGAVERLAGQGAAYGAKWSPDGEVIAFGQLDYLGPLARSFLQVPATGGEPLPLPGVPDEAALNGFAWSPDGSRIAFGGPDGIVVANADGSDPRLITGHDGSLAAGNPRWSPDGRRILYDMVATQGDAIYAWVVGRDGADPHSVSDAAGYGANWQAILEPLP